MPISSLSLVVEMKEAFHNNIILVKIVRLFDQELLKNSISREVKIVLKNIHSYSHCLSLSLV